MSRSLTVLAFSLLTTTVGSALAPARAEVPELTIVARDERANAMSVGLGLGWAQGMSVAYERSFNSWFGVRVGYAAALLPKLDFDFDLDFFGTGSEDDDEPAPNETVMAHGPTLDLVFHTEGAHAFEASAGATWLFDWADEAIPVPNLFLGYRYQPDDSALLVRVGAGLNALAGGVVASVGARF